MASVLALASCSERPEPGPARPIAAVDGDGRPASLLSAFFGLDDALPFRAHRLCLGAAGRDGMPVVLSHTIDPDTLQREDFVVRTRAGLERVPYCVTLAPAVGPGELRTVLLVGDFGGGDDPPASVHVVGDIISDGVTGGPVSFRAASVSVIPLETGPTLIWAEVVPEDQWRAGGRQAGTPCPDGTEQIVRVTWTGGIRRPDSTEVGDAERQLYRVTIERPDRSHAEVAPIALGDLGDNDNNHLLCLDVTGRPLSVSFPAGHVVDPNGDLNLGTRIRTGDPQRPSWQDRNSPT